MSGDDDFRIRPGRIRSTSAQRARPFIAQALAAAQKAWYANANVIARFLSSANPKNWPLADTQMMMKMHLDLTTAEAVARLKGQWAADVRAYDKVQAEIMQMADALSSGIVAQFPSRFAG